VCAIVSFEYPEDAEMLDNLGVAPSISWELDYWERTVELSIGAETLRLSYDQTGFVCLEWREGERRLLSLSRDRADRLTVWSKGGRSYLAVDFKGELGTDGRVTVNVYPHIEITDVQRL